jgi:hypothetical protein
MKKSELWAIYVKRNPSFDGDGNVTMTARGLRKFFETTWDTAYFDGEDELREPAPINSSDMANFESLKNLFGFR